MHQGPLWRAVLAFWVGHFFFKLWTQWLVECSPTHTRGRASDWLSASLQTFSFNYTERACTIHILLAPPPRKHPLKKKLQSFLIFRSHKLRVAAASRHPSGTAKVLAGSTLKRVCSVSLLQMMWRWRRSARPSWGPGSSSSSWWCSSCGQVGLCFLITEPKKHVLEPWCKDSSLAVTARSTLICHVGISHERVPPLKHLVVWRSQCRLTIATQPCYQWLNFKTSLFASRL